MKYDGKIRCIQSPHPQHPNLPIPLITAPHLWYQKQRDGLGLKCSLVLLVAFSFRQWKVFPWWLISRILWKSLIQPKVSSTVHLRLKHKIKNDWTCFLISLVIIREGPSFQLVSVFKKYRRTNLKAPFCTIWASGLFLHWLVGSCFSRNAAEVPPFLREVPFVSALYSFYREIKGTGLRYFI